MNCGLHCTLRLICTPSPCVSTCALCLPVCLAPPISQYAKLLLKANKAPLHGDHKNRPPTFTAAGIPPCPSPRYPPTLPYPASPPALLTPAKEVTCPLLISASHSRSASPLPHQHTLASPSSAYHASYSFPLFLCSVLRLSPP